MRRERIEMPAPRSAAASRTGVEAIRSFGSGCRERMSENPTSRILPCKAFGPTFQGRFDYFARMEGLRVKLSNSAGGREGRMSSEEPARQGRCSRLSTG